MGQQLPVYLSYFRGGNWATLACVLSYFRDGNQTTIACLPFLLQRWQLGNSSLFTFLNSEMATGRHLPVYLSYFRDGNWQQLPVYLSYFRVGNWATLTFHLSYFRDDNWVTFASEKTTAVLVFYFTCSSYFSHSNSSFLSVLFFRHDSTIVLFTVLLQI